MANPTVTSILGIPTQSAPTPDSFDIREKRVEAWIAGLPLASVGECTRQIFQALRETNRLALADNARFRFLEVLRLPISNSEQSLKKSFANHSLPLTDKASRIATLTRELNSEMAIGYKTVVEHEMLGTASHVDKRMLATAIHRAIRYQSNLLLTCFQTYELPPAGTWKNIHRLFTYAEQRGLHETVIKDQLATDELLDSTVADVYKQIVLLGLAEPYRLRQQVTEQVYHSLRAWAKLCKILPGDTEPQPEQSVVILQLDSDANPAYYHGMAGDAQHSMHRLLDTSTLTQQLTEVLLQTTNAGTNPQHIRLNEITPETLKRLIITWGGRSKRLFSRSPRNGGIALTLGLGATHHYLTTNILRDEIGNPIGFCDDARGVLVQASLDQITENSGDEPVLDNRSSYRSTPVFGISNMDDHTPDVWDPAFTYHPEVGYVMDLKSERAADQSVFRPFQCSSVNESASGFCLLGRLVANETTHKVQVGELVGIHYSGVDAEHELSIGVIRRIRRASTGIEIGVQKLAPCAVAVAIAPVRGLNQTEQYVRGLILPAIKPVKQPATLIAHALLKTGDRVIINNQGVQVQVRLTRAIESTGVFTQFEFDTMKNLPMKAEKAAAQTSINDDDFDNVWKLI